MLSVKEVFSYAGMTTWDKDKDKAVPKAHGQLCCPYGEYGFDLASGGALLCEPRFMNGCRVRYPTALPIKMRFHLTSLRTYPFSILSRGPKPQK